MSDSVTQSPLGVNVVSSLLQGNGFYINPTAQSYMGVSSNNASYTPGSLVNNTCLNLLTYAIQKAWQNCQPNGGTQLSNTTYDNLISIGAQAIPALGNSVPPTYIVDDPSGEWTGQANTGLAISGDTDHGQDASWLPYLHTNPNVSVTQWGFIRLLALQAYNEFYYNAATDGTNVTASAPSYKDFTTSFLTVDNFVNYGNKTITAIYNSQNFQKGTFSNQNDLISGELTSVSLSLQDFGQDLINLGKALNINQISKFGLPSTLLQLLKQNNTVTQNLNIAMLAAGLTVNDITSISAGATATTDQEQKLYSAYLIIQQGALTEILKALSCKTSGLTSLADLLNVKKLFPISYTTLTVPIYNTTPGPTNSKTYYLLFIEQQLNPQLIAPAVVAQVPPVVPPAPPAVSTPVIIPSVPVTQAAAGAVNAGVGPVRLGYINPTASN